MKRNFFCLVFVFAANAPAYAFAEVLPRLKIVTLVNPEENPRLFSYFRMVNSEICKRIGHNCSFDYAPGVRAALMVEFGEADGENYRIFEFGDYNENAHHRRVNEPIYEASFYAWGKKENIEVSSWRELIEANRKVLYLLGSKMVLKNLSNDMKDKLIYTPTVESGIKMLHADRASYFITSDAYNVERKVRELGLEQSIVKLGKIASTDTYMYMNKKHLLLIPKIERSIQSMKKDGTLLQLKREMDKDFQRKTSPDAS